MTPDATWDDIKQFGDEIRLKIHLAGMEARDRWHALQPKLAELEASLEDRSVRAGHAIAEQLAAMRTSLRAFRDEVFDELDPERPR